MSVRVEGTGEGISLCAKSKTSGIFWWGSFCCSCSCDGGKTKSTRSLKLKLGLWTRV